ncbi:MAG TPA: DUF1080 domain-containing protein [Bryobacteraceae bacterium]|nr:DUF1080 domain-containing protein [Bryobacteraceae bacterium]HPQ17430.1 DUF1080 domain-containing protein [Bryobacteraceae bacterium]
MKHFCLTLTIAAVGLTLSCSKPAGNPFLGRWDMTVTTPQEQYPSWMEVTEADGKLEARVQQRTGNVNPAVAVERDGNKLIVTVSAAVPARPATEDRPAMPERPALIWELTEEGGRLKGTQTRGSQTFEIVGVRAPALDHPAPVEWGEPEPLFNGKDLTGWEPINNTPQPPGGFKNNWTVKNGELVNLAQGSNLRTTRVFDDFKLHVEYNLAPGSNSGIYLRGRYEVQVAPPPSAPARESARRPAAERREREGAPRPPRNPYLGIGCIYGFLGPSSPPPFTPDWQTYDITLVGRRVTVVFNGVTTIDNEEIPGITGGALDSNEAEPGPIYLQGDHPGTLRFRNITISLPKR